VLLCVKMETELASETWYFCKKLGDGKVPKEKAVSVNFSLAVFFPFHFLTLEDGTVRLSRNIRKGLPLSAV
jgi:hypothetical protein